MDDLDTYDSYAVSMEGIARAVLLRDLRVIMAREPHLSGVSQLGLRRDWTESSDIELSGGFKSKGYRGLTRKST